MRVLGHDIEQGDSGRVFINPFVTSISSRACASSTGSGVFTVIDSESSSHRRARSTSEQCRLLEVARERHGPGGADSTPGGLAQVRAGLDPA